MGYSIFSQAKAWVAAGYGECDDKKTAKAANTIRRHFFSWYHQLALFLDASECFRVHRFFADCNACNGEYLGVTLPRDFQNVEAMWWNDYPIRLQSSWREYQVGMSPECDCRLQKFDVPGFFATALDVTAAAPKKVVVRAFDEADIGARFVVRGRAATGQPYSEEFALSTDPQETKAPLASIDRAGGIIKSITAGRVVLLDEDGRLLSIYEPDETVPAYKRIKIAGLPDGCEVVNIRGARKFFPLIGNDDVVETDNEAAFESMARYLRLYERSDKTKDSFAAEKDHYATAVQLMTGDKSRDTGRGTEAQLSFATPKLGSGGLTRFGRRR